jgi:hypothetical protein
LSLAVTLPVLIQVAVPTVASSAQLPGKVADVLAAYDGQIIAEHIATLTAATASKQRVTVMLSPEYSLNYICLPDDNVMNRPDGVICRNH